MAGSSEDTYLIKYVIKSHHIPSRLNKKTIMFKTKIFDFDFRG